MKIIKLNAIDSTNTYLKEMAREIDIENYTVVVTKYQTNGKGQYQNSWHSKKGKNLLFSILIKFKSFKIENHTYLNFAISLAVFHVLNQFLQHVKIKWPNDIMSRQRKICGILIENTVQNDKISQSIVGIGLNVNQIDFPVELEKVTSLKKELNTNFNCDDLLEQLIISVKKEILKLENNEFKELYDSYIDNLYKLNEPTMYKTKSGNLFLGKIKGVSNYGKLQVELDDETIKEFDIKEIKLVRV